MTNIHYPVKNILGGSFCKKCLNWSNMPDGLKGYECSATKEEIKNNRKERLKLEKERFQKKGTQYERN